MQIRWALTTNAGWFWNAPEDDFRHKIGRDMRFKVAPYRHPEHSKLLEKSKFLAGLWMLGHAYMVIFLAAALVAPLGILLLRFINPEIIEGRAGDFLASTVAACLLISVIGFAVRKYARWRRK
jgi:hypothetical protein